MIRLKTINIKNTMSSVSSVSLSPQQLETNCQFYWLAKNPKEAVDQTPLAFTQTFKTILDQLQETENSYPNFLFADPTYKGRYKTYHELAYKYLGVGEIEGNYAKQVLERFKSLKLGSDFPCLDEFKQNKLKQSIILTTKLAFQEHDSGSDLDKRQALTEKVIRTFQNHINGGNFYDPYLNEIYPLKQF